MSILSGESVKELFILEPCRPKYKIASISGGLGGASYDVAIAEKLVIGPGEFKLASTVERFDMPSRVAGVVHGKSSWARRGLRVENTFIDPGWEGYLTLELANLTQFDDFRIEKGTPIAQIVFHWVDKASCYEGKYQNQESGPQEAR